MTIKIEIKNKVARTVEPKSFIVCGNNDYKLEFAFDEEWAEYGAKTAYFIANGVTLPPVVFTGNQCDVPVISNATALSVGVSAGDLRTTTEAVISCRKSIRCKTGAPVEPTPVVYDQIMQMINDGMLKGERGERGFQGEKGDKGDTGEGFRISKTYASVEEMNAAFETDNVPLHHFVLIDTGNVEDEDNAKLYVKTANGYHYLTDLSGAQGIKGERGAKGEDGITYKMPYPYEEFDAMVNAANIEGLEEFFMYLYFDVINLTKTTTDSDGKATQYIVKSEWFVIQGNSTSEVFYIVLRHENEVLRLLGLEQYIEYIVISESGIARERLPLTSSGKIVLNYDEIETMPVSEFLDICRRGAQGEEITCSITDGGLWGFAEVETVLYDNEKSAGCFILSYTGDGIFYSTEVFLATSESESVVKDEKNSGTRQKLSLPTEDDKGKVLGVVYNSMGSDNEKWKYELVDLTTVLPNASTLTDEQKAKWKNFIESIMN